LILLPSVGIALLKGMEACGCRFSPRCPVLGAPAQALGRRMERRGCWELG